MLHALHLRGSLQVALDKSRRQIRPFRAPRLCKKDDAGWL
jgi:hypothetical protein